MEILEEHDDLDYMICPVSGGGLLSGTLISTKGLSPKTKVIAAEPELCKDAYLSLKEGKIHP